jgi:hypothetical protein
MNDARRPRSWEWGIVAALFLLAFWFRTYRLADVPPGLHHDDIKNVLLVEKIMTGYLRAYYPENYGHEPLYHWLQALHFSVMGSGYPEVRLVSVSVSMIGLALIYALVKRLLGRGVALWTLAWQAVSLWPLFYSRRAIRGVLLPPLAALTAYLFTMGLDGKGLPKWTGRWGTWIASGISLAACLYTYMGSRVLPVLFALYVIYLALVDRRRLQDRWTGIALFFLVTLILSLPLSAYLITHPEERMGQINMPLNAIKRGEWKPLWENSLRALGMFTFVGDPHWRQFVADTPVFEPLGAILFYAGMGLSLWRWRRFEYVFSLLWLPVTLTPAMLSEGAPNFLRPIAVQTTVYVFPALAMTVLVQWLGRRYQWVAWTVVAGLVGILAINAWRTFDGYFIHWPRHPDARFAYNATFLDESKYLDATPDMDAVVLSGHFAADLDPGLVNSFLRRTDLVPRWCDVRQSLIYPHGESAHVIQPDYFFLDPMLFEQFLGAPPPLYEHHLQDGTFVFAVYPSSVEPLNARRALAQAVPVGWSGAATFPDGLPDDFVSLNWPVTFGERVHFIGYEVPNGERVSPGDVITLITYWQVIQPGPSSGITFLHLLGPDGGVISGYDGFGAPPNRWIARDVLVQVHRFGLPSNLQPAAYPIELGWYERDTGVRWIVPTAEGGRVDRLLLQPLTVAQKEGG